VNAFAWTAERVVEALGTPPRGAAPAVYAGVSTDTRSPSPGALFVALRGERFDAHDHLHAAAAAGAAGAVVSRIPPDAPGGMAWYVVPDTLAALGALARLRRRALACRVVAVAGSNGKTTTKELLRAALGADLRVHATEANLNNRVGVPLTLLAAPDDADVAIVEVGTNLPGEVGLLSRIVEPDAALITSIGEEHLEGLGSLEGVLREELSVLDALARGAPALVAEEPAALVAGAREAVGSERVRIAGFGEAADLRPEGGRRGVRFEPGGGTSWRFRGADVRLPLPGLHNVRNALLALGLAHEWGVPPERAARGLAAMPQPRMRNEWLRIGSIGVLADCYNANPPSMRAALDLLAELPAGGDKVAVIGTMRELGGHADRLHRELAAHAAALLGRGIDRVVATGDFVAAFRAIGGNGQLVLEEDPVAAYEAFRPSLRGGETILLKGSRGVELERWIPLIERDFADSDAPPRES
jgi:UDP-N-acetylmuramoyl-tripeptide--D-alanyl-D-alanine ligase